MTRPSPHTARLVLLLRSNAAGWTGAPPPQEGHMATTDLVAFGIYPDRGAFESALEALRAADFRSSDISAILPDRDHTTKDLAHEINTKAPEGIATGAGAGAALGGVLGWLVGIGA